MKTVFYVLHFQEKNIIKIGISTNISYRITCIEKATGFIVDHPESLVVTNPARKNIRLLEKVLLNITADFKHGFKIVDDFSGMYEFRKNNCVNLITQYIRDQKAYGIIYKIYKGIDVCGQYTHKLPKLYFPVYYPAKFFSNVLTNDVLNYCQKHNIKVSDFYNEAIYEHVKKLDFDRKEDSRIEGYDKYYKH